MKVLFLTARDETLASSRIRVYQYIPYLEEAGTRCFVINMARSPAVEKGRIRIWKLVKLILLGGIKYLKVIFLSRFCDVVFIQKILLPIWRQNLIKKLNKNILIDFTLTKVLFIKKLIKI